MKSKTSISAVAVFVAKNNNISMSVRFRFSTCATFVAQVKNDARTRLVPLSGTSWLRSGLGIKNLPSEVGWKQNWYADDSACASNLHSILSWLKLLMKEGPKFGYFPEPEKSYLVVHLNQVEEAKVLFAELKVNVVTGNRFLGGYIGSTADTERWIIEKVKVWLTSIGAFSKAADTQPHLAYVLTKSLQNEWGYIQRVVTNLEKTFTLLKTTLEQSFLPALFGSNVEPVESSLFMLSSCNGGLGIRDPVATSVIAFQSSKEGTKFLSDLLL